MGVEGAQIIVEQIVFIIAAKLREAVRDDGFLFGDDIARDLAIWQSQFTGDGTVGVDVIAGMNEEIRTVFEHGAVAAHAAAAGIDTPALACGIARPDKRYRTFVRWRGSEMPDLGFTGYRSADIFKPHPVENILPGRKILEHDF